MVWFLLVVLALILLSQNKHLSEFAGFDSTVFFPWSSYVCIYSLTEIIHNYENRYTQWSYSETYEPNPANCDECSFCDNKVKPSSTCKKHAYNRQGMLPSSNGCSY